MAPRMASISLTARHATVYEPCDDSFALVDALHMHVHTIADLSPRICVEIGSGSGYVITSLALLLRSLDLSPVLLLATDINPHAAETTRETLQAHSALSAAVEDGRSSAEQAADSTAVTMAATATSTPAASTAAAAAEGGQHSRAPAVPFCADVVLTDVASAVDHRLAGCVDVIVCNPPYVVTPDEELLPPAAAPVAVPSAPETAESPADARAAAAAAAAAVLQPDALLSQAWAGGHRGRRVIDRVLPRAASLLSPHGVFFLVVVAENEPREICSVMESRGFAWEAVLVRHTEEEKLTVLRFWRSC